MEMKSLKMNMSMTMMKSMTTNLAKAEVDHKKDLVQEQEMELGKIQPKEERDIEEEQKLPQMLRMRI